MRQQAADRFDCLIATTPTHACLWDVRQPPSASFGSGSGSTVGRGGAAAARPSSPALRFAYGATTSSARGDARTSDQRCSPLVQVACQGHFCAVLNRAGFLHVFDTRMVAASAASTKNKSAATGGAVEVVPSFLHAGAGLTSYPHSTLPSEPAGSSTATSWVAWGIDAPSSTNDAVVKVWSVGGSNRDKSPPSSDDYWYMDSSFRGVDGGAPGYRLVGSCAVPNLCCARVGPAPFQDSILTVGLESSVDDPSGRWKAQVWMVKRSDGGDTSGTELESVVAFGGSSEADDAHRMDLPRLVDSASVGRLCASDLAAVVTDRQQRSDRAPPPMGHVGATRATAASSSDDVDEDDGGGPARRAVLLLCSLTDTGYLTTHVRYLRSPCSSLYSTPFSHAQL